MKAMAANVRALAAAGAKAQAGEFDTALKKGTLAVVSGKIVKQSPEAMRIKTPAAIMGVRGTEFVVKVDESATK